METVLITGSARRLGRLIAEDLARSGCFVWIHYRSHEKEAMDLRAQIRENGGMAECVQADLSRSEDMDRMLSEIMGSENGALTTLINNASVIKSGTLKNTPVDAWDQIMNTNLKAVWYLSAQFSEKFEKARRIITIGDASVSNGYEGHAVYGLSKFALKYLNEQMASAFAPGIRVNLLSPGFVLQGDGESDQSWNDRLRRTLTDNSKITEEILRAVRFLMTDPGMTGSELITDNGAHLYGKKK